MLDGQNILVIGAGIAGLATARALALRGARVTVAEAGRQGDGQGGGLQIAPNGVRVLDALGLGDAARRRSVASHAVQLLDGFTGKGITRLDLGAHAREGLDYLLFRRGDLVDLLAEGAVDAGVRILWQTAVTWPLAPQVLQRLGAADPALVLAADGFHSAARSLLNGPEAPDFAGQVAWRAVVRDDAPPETRAFLGPGMHLVSYPLAGGYRNIAAFEERSEWRAEGWHHPASPESVRQAFSSFCPEVRKLLEKVEELRIWGLFRRPVAGRWHGELPGGGRVALLGDAAHPTLPFMAQGANMALEDAWLLAAALDARPLEEALERWQALRVPRVRRAIAAADANARNYHLRGLPRYGAHKLLRIGGLVAPSLALRRFDWLYRMDVTGLKV